MRLDIDSSSSTLSLRQLERSLELRLRLVRLDSDLPSSTLSLRQLDRSLELRGGRTQRGVSVHSCLSARIVGAAWN